MKTQFNFRSEDPTFNLELFKQSPDKWLLFNRKGKQVQFIGLNPLSSIDSERSDSYYYAVHFATNGSNSVSTSVNGWYRGVGEPDSEDVFMISTETVYVHITKEIQNSFLSSQIEEDDPVIYIQQFNFLGDELSSSLIKS